MTNGGKVKYFQKYNTIKLVFFLRQLLFVYTTFIFLRIEILSSIIRDETPTYIYVREPLSYYFINNHFSCVKNSCTL